METFDFSEALRRMKQGKVVRRDDKVREFAIKDGYIVSRSVEFDNMFRIVPVMTEKFILATDWEEVTK